MLTRDQRVVTLDGGINFRDLGGYKTRNGRLVVWRKLLRSGHLAHLSTNDLSVLKDIGVNEVHDFRREDEQARSPSKLVEANISSDYYISLGSLSRFWDFLHEGKLTNRSAHDLVVTSYRDCIQDIVPMYTKFMQAILDNAKGTSLFHCSAGKDRTGIVAALILAALEVPRDTIIEDYLLTQQYLDSKHLLKIVEQHLVEAKVEFWEREWLIPYCTVHKENIQAFFDSIDESYGSIEAYLDHALSFGKHDRKRLQELFLESFK